MLFSSSCAKKPVTKVVVPSAPIGNLLNNFLIATIDAYGKNMNHAPLHYRIVYDTNKNVDSIIWSVDPSYVSFYQFSYSGNKCTTRSDTLPGDNYDLIMGLNSNGTIQYIVNYDSSAMTYTGTELIGTHIYESSSYGITYDWFGGDIDDFDYYYSNYGGPTNYEYKYYYYDVTKTGQVGDAIRIKDFLQYGRPLLLTQHIPTALRSDTGIVEQYFYQYDSQNRITQFITVSTDNSPNEIDTMIYVYTYY